MNITNLAGRSQFQSNVGTRIKERRKQVHLTLDQLAIQTGLTASFISQVERGKANVSLNSLQIIAEALGVSVIHFMARESSVGTPEAEPSSTAALPSSNGGSLFNPVVKARNRSRLVLANTNHEMELLVPDIGRKMICLKARLAPHGVHVSRPLREPTEEILYVISGILKLEFNDATYTLYPEDTIYFEGQNLLRMINESEKEDAVWILTITPGIF